jgi:hypothetical protein
MEDVATGFGFVWDVLTTLKIQGIPLLYFFLFGIIGVTVVGFVRGKK